MKIILLSLLLFIVIEASAQIDTLRVDNRLYVLLTKEQHIRTVSKDIALYKTDSTNKYIYIWYKGHEYYGVLLPEFVWNHRNK